MPHDLAEKIKIAKKKLLSLHYLTQSGHIGGNLSCLDTLMVLYHSVMQNDGRFILSKGHSAGALYVTLWSKGLLPDETLATFCGEGTVLPSHPSGAGVPGLLFPTGSLGHGPSLAAGIALALKHNEKAGTVYCLCSDGEWQEGSCWEALNFAVRHRLNNLILLVDQNGLQGFGTTKEVIGFADLAPRFTTFGASVLSVNGHNPVAIIAAIMAAGGNRPRVIVLNTCKGHGLYFEDRLESHYLPMTKEQYEEGLRRIQEETTL